MKWQKALHLVFLLGGAAGLPACDNNEHNIAEAAAKLTAQHEKALAMYCSCGLLERPDIYSSMDACEAAVGSRDEWLCEENVIAMHSGAISSIECVVDAQLALLDCLDALECYDWLAGRHDCGTEYDHLANTCEPLPYALRLDLGYHCYDEPFEDPFTCGDGFQIRSSQACDGRADCIDRSDETDCS